MEPIVGQKILIEWIIHCQLEDYSEPRLITPEEDQKIQEFLKIPRHFPVCASTAMMASSLGLP